MIRSRSVSRTVPSVKSSGTAYTVSGSVQAPNWATTGRSAKSSAQAMVPTAAARGQRHRLPGERADRQQIEEVLEATRVRAAIDRRDEHARATALDRVDGDAGRAVVLRRRATVAPRDPVAQIERRHLATLQPGGIGKRTSEQGGASAARTAAHTDEPGHAAVGAAKVNSPGKWHATTCPDAASCSGGRTCPHTSRALPIGQRDWNGQP